MKKVNVFIAVVLLTALFTGCMTTEAPRVAGELPKNWWKMEIDQLENLYRSTAEGRETKVKLFIGISDEPTNSTESDSYEDATMKVSVEISQYLAQLVTNISQSVKFNDYVKQVVNDSSVKKGSTERILNEVTNQVNRFSAIISTTQFSSMKIIGKHAEKVKNEDYYKGWVCVSMTDDILEQTRKLQEEAFKTLIELNPDYKQIIADINTEITKSIKDNITDKTDIK